MSTIGRKAMKKTLKRLKKDALNDAGMCIDVITKLWKQIDEMSQEEEKLFNLFNEYAPRAVISLLRYVQALEDYGYELDEEWDKLLKSVEQIKQGKVGQNKGKTNKTSYIK